MRTSQTRSHFCSNDVADNATGTHGAPTAGAEDGVACRRAPVHRADSQGCPTAMAEGGPCDLEDSDLECVGAWLAGEDKDKLQQRLQVWAA